MAGALIGQAMPIFWLGIMLITLFSVKLGWLPTSGRGSLAQLIMPSVTLSSAGSRGSPRHERIAS
jgi:ABC-type dipeptide/oligopeptide/nickel transport system permease component